MKFIESHIQDVKIIVPEVFNDERGSFMETFRDDWFNENIAECNFVQENYSFSKKNVLRGLHYQVSRPQGKLIRVISGEIFDVGVDLRKSSNTFGQVITCVLSSSNQYSLWMPEGFAHGFYVLSEIAKVSYKCTDYYSKFDEQCILWNDDELKIKWPLQQLSPILSGKDLLGVSFKNTIFFD